MQQLGERGVVGFHKMSDLKIMKEIIPGRVLFTKHFVFKEFEKCGKAFVFPE